MKKISFMILTLLIGFSSISFAAGNDKVDNATLVSFRHDFQNATNVSWAQTSTCYKATFELDGQTIYAYYGKNEAGLIAVTRFILSSQLPLNLQQELRSKLKDGWIADLFEVASGGETYYYATIENSAAKTIFKSSGFSNWSQISKAAK
jgi:hypothetical protein